MSTSNEWNDPEDRALLHLINGTDPGVKGLILDLLRSSSGRFQNAPVAIRGLMADLLIGMRLNGAADTEIESRFGLTRGDAAVLERVLLGRREKGNGKRPGWKRWPAAGRPQARSSTTSPDSREG